MKHFYLDPKTLLGGVVHRNDRQEIVHLSLMAGNTVPSYQMDAQIDLFVIEGRLELSLGERGEEKTLTLGPRELVVVEPSQAHQMKALADSQVLVIKVK